MITNEFVRAYLSEVKEKMERNKNSCGKELDRLAKEIDELKIRLERLIKEKYDILDTYDEYCDAIYEIDELLAKD